MFINYQKVRNAVVGTCVAIGAGFAAIFGFGGGDDRQPEPASERVAQVQPTTRARTPSRQPAPVVEPSEIAVPKQLANASAPTATAANNFIPAQRVEPKPKSRQSSRHVKPTAAAMTDAQRYAAAMKLALGKAAKDGFAKDVLGAGSKWKLNLYDDNLDGQYDRGKLDKDRNDIDDEQWTFKQGRWEKDGGRMLWLGGRWTSDPGMTAAKTTSGQSAISPALKRYRAAMQIATARADRSGKGKDVLGSRSPWKLNLYDDNKDGQWDRAKLDTNRDEKDDEKWNFKKGRWEKDGGATIWNGKDWQAN